MHIRAMALNACVTNHYDYFGWLLSSLGGSPSPSPLGSLFPFPPLQRPSSMRRLNIIFYRHPQKTIDRIAERERENKTLDSRLKCTQGHRVYFCGPNREFRRHAPLSEEAHVESRQIAATYRDG